LSIVAVLLLAAVIAKDAEDPPKRRFRRAAAYDVEPLAEVDETVASIFKEYDELLVRFLGTYDGSVSSSSSSKSSKGSKVSKGSSSKVRDPASSGWGTCYPRTDLALSALSKALRTVVLTLV